MSKRILLAATLGLASLQSGISPVRAQDTTAATAPTAYIYSVAGGLGRNKLGAWGNGQARVSRDQQYNGSDTLRVTTVNSYEGARFDLANPIDITPYKRDGYVRLQVHFNRAFTPQPGGPDGMPGFDPAQGGWPGGQPGGGWQGGGQPGGWNGGGQPGGFNGGGQPGGFNPFGLLPLPELKGRPTTSRMAQFGPLPTPGAQVPGGWGGGPQGGPFGGGQMPIDPATGMPFDPAMGGEMQVPTGPPPQYTPITRFRVMMLHDTGATFGTVPVDLNTIQPDEDGWRMLYAPLSQMRSTPDVSGPVRRVVLTGDKQDTFALAQMALVVETGKMSASIRQPRDEFNAQIAEVTVKPGPVTLVADVEAGTADPIIEWNFDADNVGNIPVAGAAPLAMDPAMMGVDPAMAGMDPGMGAPVPAGPRIDAKGITARFTYPDEEQNYRVEITVRDRRGVKAPAKASIIVKVRA